MEKRVGKGRKRERRRGGAGEGREGAGSPPKLKLGPPEVFSWRRIWLRGLAHKSRFAHPSPKFTGGRG